MRVGRYVNEHDVACDFFAPTEWWRIREVKQRVWKSGGIQSAEEVGRFPEWREPELTAKERKVHLTRSREVKKHQERHRRSMMEKQ